MANGSSPTSVAPPPRLSGTVEQRLTTLTQWLWDFYSRINLTDLFVRFAEQFSAATFDPASLPDPSNTTIAQAQETANNAFILASSATTKAEAAQAAADSALNKVGFNGQFTVSDASTTASVTFAQAEADTTYNVVATPVAFSGVPIVGAFTIQKIDKTVNGFTVTFTSAPGVGASVTYDYQLRRD